MYPSLLKRKKPPNEKPEDARTIIESFKKVRIAISAGELRLKTGTNKSLHESTSFKLILTRIDR